MPIHIAITRLLQMAKKQDLLQPVLFQRRSLINSVIIP